MLMQQTIWRCRNFKLHYKVKKRKKYAEKIQQLVSKQKVQDRRQDKEQKLPVNQISYDEVQILLRE